MADRGRYARDWDAYSADWDSNYGKRYEHLGDEWNDDATPEREREAFYFHAYVERCISPDMKVLEIGPGGGKWTVKIAPRVARVAVIDVSKEMLERTRVRCEQLGLDNIDYHLTEGEDFQVIEDASVQFVFSYDVFVHIALEDLWVYTKELARVLAPGGRAAIHHAVHSTPDAWDRIEATNDHYRHGRHTLGQYYYYSPDSLRRLFERCGLRVLEQHLEKWQCTSIIERPRASTVPTLEALLGRLASAECDSPAARDEVIDSLRTLPERLADLLSPLLDAARSEPDAAARQHLGIEIRRLFRGS